MPLHQRQPSIASPAIRDSARGESCTVRAEGFCNWNPETVVFAHLTFEPKSCNHKVDDLFGCYACSGCHDAIDRYLLPETMRALILVRAMVETQRILLRKGLIVIPDRRIAEYEAPAKQLRRR